ncbi:hypothetical protein [Salinicoccus roseus]|uniref:hypothetical protein n=1 Tax=Salinicoccus roseus TaxID=45670 RepID=UPI002301C307|nr:hypothetical protein [Salinicoccus roseus]
MKKGQFRGYLLEDIISHLLEVNGYDLITTDESSGICKKGNGLNVVGRGGVHQFDSLGEFKWNYPFTYPIRLFVEAKFWKEGRKERNRVGINVIRNGLGVLTDVNQGETTVNSNTISLLGRKYQYHYAVFSTTGFSKDAIRFALAHKIHLVDLNSREYKSLLDSIENFTNIIFEKYSLDKKNISKEYAKWVRVWIRYKLGLTANISKYLNEYNEDFNNNKMGNISSDTLEKFKLLMEGIYEKELESLGDIKAIYLASSKSPFIIGMTSNRLQDHENFIASIKENNRQEVSITFEENENKEMWYIKNGGEKEYTLSFQLPKLLAEYIFSENNKRIYQTAYNAKGKFLTELNLMVKIEEGQNPVHCTLIYSPELTDKRVQKDNE